MSDEETDWKEFGQAMKERGKHRRHRNARQTARLLKKAGIAHESKNHGFHLIVTHYGMVIDFWPSTGKYIFRVGIVGWPKAGHQGRGVKGLLKDIGVEVPA